MKWIFNIAINSGGSWMAGREGMSLNTEWPFSKTTTRMIFDLKYFWRNRKKKTPRKASFYFFFSPEKFARLVLLQEVMFSSNCRMIKLTIFDTPVTCFRQYDIFTKTHSRMTRISLFPTKMTLVHPRAQLSQWYWGNLLLVVLFVESLKVSYIALRLLVKV